MLGMTFWWNSNHIWLCAEIGRTGWSQTPVSERTCGFDSHQSYKYTFVAQWLRRTTLRMWKPKGLCGFDSHQSYKHTLVVERQTRYTKDVESERALRVRIPPRVLILLIIKTMCWVLNHVYLPKWSNGLVGIMRLSRNCKCPR